MSRDQMRQLKIAYHTGEYPRATDTFIQREVAGVRAAGADVITCSVRKTDASHHVGPEQREEYQNTFYVQEAAKSPAKLLGAHWRLLTTSPGSYFKTMGLAIKTSPPGIKNALYQVFYFAEAGVLAAHLMDQKVDHLHNHFSNSSCSVAMLASEMSGISFSMMIHGPAIFFEPDKWRLDEKIARAKFATCISHFCRSQSMIYADTEYWPKLHIVHCGVDPEKYQKDLTRSDNDVRLLFVGRLAAVKGLPVLLQSLKTLSQTYPNLKLTVIGDGSDRAALERQSLELGLADNVEFVGYKSQAEVAEELSRTDIFVLPSFAEGVPVVLMEALAAQCPVVTTRIAGIGELVEDGVSGYTVPPGNVDALTDRLSDLIENQDLREKMGKAGRDKVVEDYDILKESARLHQILQAYLLGADSTPGVRPD